MYPSNQQYKESVENGLFLIEGEFKQNLYRAIKNAKGELIYETGQNATVFKVKDETGNPKALKLFFREDAERSYRYKVIGEYLDCLNSNYFIDFEYYENFIYVHGVNSDTEENYFPAVIMDWVEGMTLEGIIKNLTFKNDIRSLRTLSSNFLALSQFLLSSDFSHGDLKHDNLIVVDNLELKLIDYDGVYVPALAGECSFELGTKSFQHPNRKKEDFNERIDDFSILSVYVSLLTFSKYPSYYERFSDQQNLFFREEDFLSPADSEIFNLLNQDNDLKPYVISIISSLKQDSIYIDNLSDILKGDFPKPKFRSEVYSKYEFYNDDDKVIALDLENCQEVEVLINNSNTGNFHFEKLSNTLLIHLDEADIKEVSITLKNAFSELKKLIKVDIQPRSEVLQFKFNNSAFKEGGEVILYYTFKHVKYAELKHENDPSFSRVLDSDKGKVSFNIQQAAKYYLKIVDLLGKVILTEYKELVIVYPIEILSFKSNYSNIFEGIPIELSWEIKHADKIILWNDRFEKEDVSGLERISLTPIKNVNYTLECSNKYYEQKFPQKVHIYVQPNPHTLSLSNLTPNLKDLNLEYELDKIDLGDWDLTIPNLDIDLNFNINLTEEGEIEVQPLNKESIKNQLYNLLKFRK